MFLSLSLSRQARFLPQIISRSHIDSPSFRERWADLDDEEKARVRKSRKSKPWAQPMPEQDHYLAAFNVNTSKYGIFQNKGSIKLTEWMAWYKSRQMEYLRWSQRYIPERQQILGNDLALAHFILHRKGRIRRKGSKEFLEPDDLTKIPNTYQPTFFVEEVDASGMNLCYEGLENFISTPRLKIAAFRNCRYLDEWCLEKILWLCPNLELLDISDNEQITERALEGVYRAWNLKKLIVTDWGYGPELELTCLMLEEANPHLTVEIKKSCPERTVLIPTCGINESIVNKDQVVK